MGKPYDVPGSIQGEVAPGFESLKQLFERETQTMAERNAQLCVYYQGERVVDLWRSAEDDPQFFRTQRVREREHVFIETLNEHYADFYFNASGSYDGWREYAREEAIAVKELQRSSRWRTGMGIATIVASVLYGANSEGNFSDRMVRDTLMYMGMDLIKTARVRREEKRLHAEALEELSTSFDDEVKPMVVEIEGTQHRLEGTAEIQYEEWRELLRQLYTAETGFAADYDMYTEDVVALEEAVEGPTQAPDPTLAPDTTLAPAVIATEAENTDAEEAEGDVEDAPEDGLAGATAGI